MSQASVCSDAAAVILSVCKRLPFQRDRGKARGRRRRSRFSSHHWFPWALDGALLSLCAICSGFGWKASPGLVWADGFAPVLPEATTQPRVGESGTKGEGAASRSLAALSAGGGELLQPLLCSGGSPKPAPEFYSSAGHRPCSLQLPPAPAALFSSSNWRSSDFTSLTASWGRGDKMGSVSGAHSAHVQVKFLCSEIHSQEKTVEKRGIFLHLLCIQL